MGDNLDIQELVAKITKNVNWFIFSVIVFLALGFVYLRYTKPKYAAKAKIQIIEDANGTSSLNLFSELGTFPGMKNEVEDEIEIINSRSNLIDVVKRLGLNTKIQVMGNIRSQEIYEDRPINVSYIVPDSLLNRTKYDFYVTLQSKTNFGFNDEEDQPSKLYSYGKNISTPIGDIVITPNLEVFDRFKDSKLHVSVSPVSKTAERFNNKINISAADDFSNIVQISLEDPVRRKAIDIINELIKVYNENAIKDKKVIADRTSDFIDDRIADISTNLSSVDQESQDLKTRRGLVADGATEASINLNVGAATRQELANAETQYNIASSMKDIVDQQSGYEVLPANLANDPSIAGTTQRYNQLVQERKRLLKSSNEKNPIIVNLDQELNSLKTTLKASLNSTVNNLGLQVNTLSGQQAIINSKIYSAPSKERALRDITRRQQTTESLYLYLLQKREEAQIAVASTSPKSKVVDYAYSSEDPVSPKNKVVYLASFLLGLLVPFSVLYVKDILDNKIHNMQDLAKLVKNIPILGEIPRLKKKENKVIIKDDRSVLSEALRILRTNLDYIIKTKDTINRDKKNNVIFITSSVSGEGKTFISSNISMILASANKKVLLIGADVRNPKIYTFFSNDTKSNGVFSKKQTRSERIGLTDYLYDDGISIEEIVTPINFNDHRIDLIHSGRIPPNPAELLLSDRMGNLIEEVSAYYDYVIVDTAPLMVVTDTLLISNYADHLIYVVRADVTENKAVEYPMKLQEEGKIKGLCFVVNDVKIANLGYGGKYGYGYGVTTKKWWKK